MTVSYSEPCVSVALDRALRELAAERVYDQDRVSAAIRNALNNWNLGKRKPGVPFADIVEPGSVVLVKPNWVHHDNNTRSGVECLYTHPTFLTAVLRELVAARPSRIIVGDAPIQSCDFDAIVTPALRREIQSIGSAAGVSIDIIDFRRTVMARSRFRTSIITNRRSESRYVLFDLGTNSLLEPVADIRPRFRVSFYDPRLLASVHCQGTHQYLICREAFEADVVISLPKLKTHCKAGLTGALKNLVGLNGNKDYLPHYRAGGSGHGGDSFEGGSLLRIAAEHIEDKANEHIGTMLYPWLCLAAGGLKRLAGGSNEMGGGWYGNDTVWRMVLDLNRILLYGRADSTMAETPQRVFYSLTDALVCGQGDGPLRPKPVVIGAVTFGASPVACDLVHAALLRLDAARIPLLRESTKRFRWPLVEEEFTVVARVNGVAMSLNDVAMDLGVAAEAPSGWKGKCELKTAAISATPQDGLGQ